MDNCTIMQYFEWNLPTDQKHWERLKYDVGHLADIGITAVWLPPCSKATSPYDVGYGVYDLYDLGEFDQKGSVATKYGNRDELLSAVDALHAAGICVYADIVLNHKAAADETEEITVVEVDRNNRNRVISDPYTITAWTRFTFPGRQGKYSSFVWGWQHFTATDYDQRTGRSSIFRIVGENKSFSDKVDHELGNYDYLMFANIDYHHPDVVSETLIWGKWLCDTLHLDGMRMDAVKHISEDFLELFVKTMQEHVQKPFFAVAEYWKDDTDRLRSYLSNVNYYMKLFDVPLHFNFFDAGNRGRDFDLRAIFDGSLLQVNPMNVVTFVDNHDSQCHQALASCVSESFKISAYALILLRKDGYPCVFLGDYYGIGGNDPVPGRKDDLDPLLYARKKYAYGEQIDTFDHANVIAWQRMGDSDHPNSGLAAIISNGDDGYKDLRFGHDAAGTIWHDITGHITDDVTLSGEGIGRFYVRGSSVSVWVRES
jgi:alpha-amylase